MRFLPIVLRMCGVALVCAPALSHGQAHQSWVQRYTGRGGVQHLSAGPALGSNAVYLAGRLQVQPEGDAQIAIVGYGLQTTEFIEALHNPSAGESDNPTALEVLPDGNLGMAGTSGAYLSSALLAAKFSRAGAEIWSRRFEGANFDPDQPASLAFDAAGSVYVAGTTLTPASDVVAIKYSEDGRQQWTARFSGIAGGACDVSGIKADASGVYLTGRVQVGNDVDLYTRKYDADGNEAWMRRYGGPSRQQEDAGGLALDGNGKVYVLGSSIGQSGAGVSRYELVAIKYSASGEELWATRYGLQGDINAVRRGLAVDSEDNLFVLANLQEGTDDQWLLLKFDGSGKPILTARYNGVENGYDSSYALALDAAGDAYVVAAASPDPDPWQFVTAKFDAAGNRRWAAKFDADGIFDFPVGIAVDRDRYVYVAGQSREFTGSGGFLTIRYAQPGTPPPAGPAIVTPPRSQMAAGGSSVTFDVDASGAQLSYQWRYNGRRIADATNSALTLNSVVLEQSGHYSVEVSNSEGSVASPEAELLVLIPPSITAAPRDQFAYAGTEVTFSVSAYGTEPFQFQWWRDQMPLSNGVGRVLNLRNLQVSDAGEYRAVVSNIAGAATSAVARLTVSRLAQQEWVDTYDGPGHDTDANPIVKVDGAGNVYVGGTSRGTRNADFAFIKYDPHGTRLWTARYSATTETTEALFAMEVDSSGVVWATGTTATNQTESEALTVSVAADGALRWARRFAVPNSFAAGFAMAVDHAGACHVAGQAGEDFLTLKYDFAGTEVWNATFNGVADGVDTARAISVSGMNVYVTGSSWNGSNLDFLTLKYGAAGNLLWPAIYDAGGTDNAIAVAVDPAGNVLVAGNSYGTINYDEFGSDYLVAKYTPEGARLWAARYDGAMSAEDYPSALAVDEVGNVYVTGHSDFESPDSGVRQFATLKYGPDGRELWRSWHIGQQYDGSRSLAIDASGSVYITSLATAPFSGRDIAFIKYDAFGTRLLTVSYSGAGNADDIPSTLALGPLGEVYVAGMTSGATDGGLDFGLVKYSQNPVSGLPIITEGPRSAEVAQGRGVTFTVVAGGEAPLSYQWFFNDEVIAGATEESFVINSTNFDDTGSYAVRVGNRHGSVVSAAAVLLVQAPPSILAGPQSQMAVAGSSPSMTVTAVGSEPFWYQWLVNGRAVSGATNRQLILHNVQATNAGNYSVVVSNGVGSATSDAARLRVTLAAQQRWAARFPGYDPGGVPVAMAIGADGSMHVAGAVNSGASTDFGVTKLSPDGGALWSRSYNGAGDGFDVATDIAVDAAGNVYVTGDSWGGPSQVDAATIKFDREGNQLWVARYNGPSNPEDISHAIAVDSSGNVTVALSTVLSVNNTDYVTVSYNSLGTQRWVAVYDGPAHAFDQPVDVVTDSAGRVYVTGSSIAGINTDFATIKYDTNGVELWRRLYNSPSNFDDVAVRIGLDALGNVFVAGWSSDSNQVTDYSLVKYLADGQQAWEARFGGLSQGHDYLSDMIVDPAGNAYVTGTSHSMHEGADWITLKFNPDGQRMWLATFGGRFGVSDNLPLLTFDASGNISLAGSLYTGESFGTATARYDTNGNRTWTAIYGADTSANEFAEAIAADRDGNVLVAGSSYFSQAFESFVIKYAQSNVIGAPTITRPPASSTVMAEASAGFGVSAEGDAPLSYRWLRGRFPIAEGVTNLVIYNAADALAGYYSVEVQNERGAVVSAAAELRVSGPALPRLRTELRNGLLRLTVLGESGFNYRIEGSSDLRAWEVLSTTYNQNSSIVISEPLSAAYRYYRAVKLP